MARKGYYPGSMAAQIAWHQNLIVKLPIVGASLGFTPAEIAAAVAVSQAFVTMMMECMQLTTQLKAMTQWKTKAAYGPMTGKDVEVPPTVVTPTSPEVSTGLMEQIGKVREKAMASLNYSLTIGEELGFVGAEISPRPPAEVRPLLKSVTASGRNVTITGSLQGFKGMYVFYAKNGGAFAKVDTVMKTPAVVHIPTTTPGVPEIGQIKTIFAVDNQPYGEFSPNFDVTLT